MKMIGRNFCKRILINFQLGNKLEDIDILLLRLQEVGVNVLSRASGHTQPVL